MYAQYIARLRLLQSLWCYNGSWVPKWSSVIWFGMWRNAIVWHSETAFVGSGYVWLLTVYCRWDWVPLQSHNHPLLRVADSVGCVPDSCISGFRLWMVNKLAYIHSFTSVERGHLPSLLMVFPWLSSFVCGVGMGNTQEISYSKFGLYFNSFQPAVGNH